MPSLPPPWNGTSDPCNVGGTSSRPWERRSAAGRAGWCSCGRFGRLTNQWACDHAHGLAGGTPILALDMYEHAYHMDFGANAGEYVETFMRNISWDRVAARFQNAQRGRVAPAAPDPYSVSAIELQRLLRGPSVAVPIVLDVRLKEDRTRDALPGTPWRDMENVGEWCQELPPDRKIVVYCKYGFWVSRDTAEALRSRGYDAAILRGGISAWRGMGLATEAI